MEGKTCILIPAYRPEKEMLQLIDALRESMSALCEIVVVDDGSGEEYHALFEQAAARGCHVLSYAQNCGKGHALKTGIAYARQQGFSVTITVDADGQHTPRDILRMCEAAERSPQSLLLGVRDLRQMPLRSKAGNMLTKWLFLLLYGRRLQDTQTGLRAIPACYFEQIEALAGERYELEMNMLIWAAKKGVATPELVIETVYLHDNASSHFHALRDGLRIYKLLFGQISMFTLSSLLAFGIDFSLFALLTKLFGTSLLLGTVGARLVSSAFNYCFNSRVVFRQARGWKSFVSYYALVLVILALNYGVLYSLTHFLRLPTLLAKLITEILLYFVSFRMQQSVIFRTNCAAPQEKEKRSDDAL